MAMASFGRFMEMSSISSVDHVITFVFFESYCQFGSLCVTEKSGFAKKLIGLVDIDNHLPTVVGNPANLDLAANHQIDAAGGLIVVVYCLAFLIVENSGTR